MIGGARGVLEIRSDEFKDASCGGGVGEVASGALGDASNKDVPARADERRAPATPGGRAVERLSDTTGDMGIETDSDLTAVAERRLDVRV